MILIAYVQLKTHADVSRESKGLKFGLSLHLHSYFVYASSKGSGLKVIKLEFILKLKLKHNDWLLVDTCLQATNHCALFEFETVLKFYNLEALCICADSSEPSLLTDTIKYRNFVHWHIFTRGQSVSNCCPACINPSLAGQGLRSLSLKICSMSAKYQQFQALKGKSENKSRSYYYLLNSESKC